MPHDIRKSLRTSGYCTFTHRNADYFGVLGGKLVKLSSLWARATVEQTIRMSVQQLRQAGILGVGRRGMILLTILDRGQIRRITIALAPLAGPRHPEVQSLEIREDGLSLAYHTVHRVAAGFGGFRYYLACSWCGRRVTALYWGDRSFGCRHCQDLVYTSSQAHETHDEKWRRALAMEERSMWLQADGHPRRAERLNLEAHLAKYDYFFAEIELQRAKIGKLERDIWRTGG